MSLASSIQISDQDINTISSVKNAELLGQVATTSDGRTYRYAKAGAAELAPGKLVVNADVDSNVVNEGVNVAAAVGSTTVQLDAGGTIAADAYAGGYLTINDAAGEGRSYFVVGNSAGSTGVDVTVYLKEALTVALTTSSEATLTVSPYSAVVISATDQADKAVGVPNVTVTAAYYCWVQTGGVCAVLWDEAVAKGLSLTIGTGVAGAVEAADAAGEQEIGVAIMAGVDTEYQPAWLSIY